MNWLTEYQAFTQTPWSPTVLKTNEEQKFKEWLKGTQLFSSIKEEIAAENKIPVNKLNNNRVVEMILSNPDYDYRGAFLSGVKEVIDPRDNKPHWPSSTPEGKMLKDPTHPTAWKEFFMRQYGIDPDEMGFDTLGKAKEWQSLVDAEQELDTSFQQNPLVSPIK